MTRRTGGQMTRRLTPEEREMVGRARAALQRARTSLREARLGRVGTADREIERASQGEVGATGYAQQRLGDGMYVVAAKYVMAAAAWRDAREAWERVAMGGGTQA